MAQLDDIVGSVMKYLKDNGLEDDTIVAFSTDNGTENFTWPDGGQTPFAGGKGTALEGGFRVPAIVRWPGKVPAGKVENGIVSGLDWFPTFVAAAGNPNIVDELKKGKQLGDSELQGPPRRLQPVGPDHRQGPVQAPRDLLLHRGHAERGAHQRLQIPLHRSAERLAWRHGKGRLADPDQSPARPVRAHRHVQRQGQGRWPITTGSPTSSGGFVFVQQEVAKAAQTFIEFPPMQKGASFNMEAIKEKLEEQMKKHAQ